MEQELKKLYKWPSCSSFILVFIGLGLILLFIIVPIVNETVDLWLIAGSIPFVFAVMLLIICGYLTPVCVSPKGVSYKKQFIEWDNLQITLLPRTEPYSNIYTYYVLFSNGKMNYKEIRHQTLIGGRWVFLREDVLTNILQYYDKPILVLDFQTRKHCGIGKMDGLSELNKIVNDHNAKYE